MQRISLDEHIRQSRIAAEANKAKGNRHGQILSGLYSNPAHFIEELIQNAEDAYSRSKNNDQKASILFEMQADGIHVYHNGHDFDEQDLKAITTFAVTTKKGQTVVNQIGKFGIGFRSVFGITEMPEIHSGPYHFAIKDYEVLEPTNPKGKLGYGTFIFLPYKKGIGQVIIDSLKQGFKQLSFHALLFIEKIHRIEATTPDDRILVEKIVLRQDDFSCDIQINQILNDQKTSFYFRLFSHHKGKHAFSIALALDSDCQSYIPMDRQCLSVYFPTLQPIGPSFAIHGNFTTTPNREQIPFNESLAPENIEKLELLGTFFKRVLNFESRKGRITASFFQLFPFEHKPHDVVSRKLMEVLDETLSQTKLLAGENGALHIPTDLCWPDDPAMRELMKRNEIRLWFDRIDWLHPDFADQPEFVQYLVRQHKLKKIDNESFAFYLSYHPEVLRKRPMEWFQRFYRYLVKYPPLWNREKDGSYFNLRHKPLIPDQKRNLLAPFDKNGQALIHLGESNKNLHTVHPDLQADSHCFDFFQMLGLQEAKTENSQLEQLLSKSGKLSSRNASAWLFALFGIYQKQNDSVMHRIRFSCESIACIPTHTAGEAITTLTEPTNCFLPLTRLKHWFSEKQLPFVSPILTKYFEKQGVSEKQLFDFLQFIGVNHLPRKILIEADFDKETLKKMRGEFDFSPIVKQSIQNFTIEGLDDFLQSPTRPRSAALMQFLSEMPLDWFEGTYSWESYIRTEQILFELDFVNKLRSVAWLPDNSGNFYKPEAISMGNLHPSCQHIGIDQQRLQALLKFANAEPSTLSEAEMALIQKLRENNIAPASLMNIEAKGVEAYPASFSVIPYTPMVLADKNKGLRPLNAAEQQSLFPAFCSTSNDFPLLTASVRYSAMTFRYLSTERYAYSSEIRLTEIKSGYFHLFKNNIFLSHIFCGGFGIGNNTVVLDSNLHQLLKEQPHRKDIVLYIWEEGSAGTLLHDIEQVQAFLLNHAISSPIITIQW